MPRVPKPIVLFILIFVPGTPCQGFPLVRFSSVADVEVAPSHPPTPNWRPLMAAVSSGLSHSSLERASASPFSSPGTYSIVTSQCCNFIPSLQMQ